MYFTPLLMFKKYAHEMPDNIRLQAYEVLVEHLNRVTWGQALDIYWHRNSKIPSIKEYLQMCCYKTGAIDRMVSSLATVLTQTDDSTTNMLKEFGEKLGICLQIHDDFSDVCTMDRKLIGEKDIGNDITEGKKSIVNIATLLNLEEEDRQVLLSILLEHTSDFGRIKTALNLIEKSDALSQVLSLAEKEFNHLKKIIVAILNEKYSSMIGSFIDAMVRDMKLKYEQRVVK